MTLVSILLPLIMQSAAPAKQADLVDLQIRATQAHKAYRERARSAQRCEEQTARFNGTAARAAAEALQQRRELLAALAIRAAQPSRAGQDQETSASELGKAVSLLTRDFETSAAMMSKADPRSAEPTTRSFLSQAPVPPQPGVLAAGDVGSGLNTNSVVAAMLSEIVNEESLLNAYFATSRIELERACMEKSEAKSDPFRVPAKATKRAKGVKR